jgi:DNA-binding CsgD family transcriptional regulator
MADSLIRHLTLVPLGADATRALLTQELEHEPAPPFATACFEVSGGNPFLLRELARTLAQRGIDPLPEHAEQVRGLVPERVAQTVSMRIERLPPSAGAVARALAILGEESDLRLVAELAEVDPTEAAGAADKLRASAILDGGGDLRFVHPLVRSALYESVPVGERMAAHTLAAKLLREANSSPERVATQLLAGEARGELATVETLLEAGEGAMASGALRSAIAYLTRALREPAPGELRPAVLEPLMVASFRTADQATFAAIEADINAELERAPSLLSRWAVSLTMALALSGRFEDGTAVLRDALELAVEESDAERSLILGAQHNTLAAIAASVPLLDLGRYADQIDPDSPAGRLVAANEARAAMARGRPEEAADAAKRALGSGAVIFAEETEATAPVGVVLVLIGADELAPARNAVERALKIAREQGATAALVRALMLSGLVGWGEGDLVRAEPDIRQAVELARSLGSAPLVLSITPVLMEVLIERDELEAAERAMEATGVSDGPMPESPILTLMLYARGHLRVARSEFHLAVEDFKALSLEKGVWSFGSLTASYAGPLAAQALRALGDDQAGRELAESMKPLARRWDRPSTVAHMLRTRAAVQDGDESIGDLEKAAAVLEDSPRRLERAHALLDLGEALRRGGRRSDARGPLREALELGRRCGAVRIARQAHDELLASGEKVRRYTPIGIESLTPSERRVAELAASGMTNRQIAQSLFVTVKTVEAHLSAAYDKLDVDSRRQLPAALGERN